MKQYILCVDLGTTSCKGVLFDEAFQVVASAKKEYQTFYPNAGYAEQPASQWWSALTVTTKEVLEKSKIVSSQIMAVAIDAFSTTVLPVDKNGEPLRPGLIWMDRRANAQAERVATAMNLELKEISGNFSDAGNAAPKIMWIKENEPSLYKETNLFLHANGYLVYKLTGIYSMDRSEAGLSQLCNTAIGEYSDTLLHGYQIEKAKLPQIFDCSDVVGKITASASAQTGLAEGTPVIAGAMDNVAAGLGAGVTKGGEVFISGGTVTTNNVCLDEAKFNDNLHTYSHIVPGKFITSGGVDFGGAGLKWFKEILEVEEYEKITALADTSVCGKSSILFLPYMVGQRCPVRNNHTSGVLIGLKPKTNRQDLIRAFMEGTTYGSRHVLELVKEEGVPISKLKITGGSANSDTWVQIFSDVIGKPIDIPGTHDLPPLGMAIAAAYGVGAIKSFEEGTTLAPIRKSFHPVEKNHLYYSEMYNVFRSLYENIKEEYDRLAEIEKKYGNP